MGGAFEAYLQRLPQERHAKTMALLTALAFGEGNGLPRRLWVRVATRLSGIPLVQADVDLLLDEDGSYLAHAEVDGARGRSGGRMRPHRHPMRPGPLQLLVVRTPLAVPRITGLSRYRGRPGLV
ncbi:hypothetical protein AB0L74_22010 [Streptomyces sp. NPDC052020]|uniref:hypothetical protein n=1 Tax=Streptomyces sp. NPDC052020 TaxID=3155677 RepID=UPI003428ABEF